MLKKARAVSIFTALIISISFFFSFSITGNCAVTGFSVEEAAATYEQIPGTSIYFESGVSEESKTAAITAWLLIPESLRVELVRYGCNIYLSGSAGTDSNTTGYSSSVGYRYILNTGVISGITSNPYIIVRTASDNVTRTLIHEAAHILDSSIAFLQGGVYEENQNVISSSDEWKAICSVYAEVLGVRDSNALRGDEEAFAASFAIYCMDPEWLTQSCPEVYNFITQAVQTYTANE